MILSPKLDIQRSCTLHLNTSDKSLSHRSVIFAFLTQGKSEIKDFLISKDTLATLQIAQRLGAQIEFKSPSHFFILPPAQISSSALLQCQNSGTSLRLYAGLLSGKEGEFVLDGDESLRKRPMQRIREPLEEMGAKFSSSFAPLKICGNPKLQAIHYRSSIASAQVKSAFILSALGANGESIYIEPELSRDHSERFLSFLGAEIDRQNDEIVITPLKSPLPSYQIKIPNDPSSAIFFVVACLISRDMELKICDVLLNPTRIYALEILKQMGAKLHYEARSKEFEEVGDIWIKSSDLVGIEISSKIAWIIDEVPALCIAFACARGRSKIVHAKELRFKESDRICAIVSNLQRLGIEAYELEDGLEIIGGEFEYGILESYGDHRIAMSFALVGIKTQVEIRGTECVDISFPQFFKFLSQFVEIKER